MLVALLLTRISTGPARAVVCFDQILDRLPAPDMAGDGDDLAGQRRKLTSRGFKVLQLAAGNDDLGAGRGQALGDGFADAASAARYEGNPIFQSEA